MTQPLMDYLWMDALLEHEGCGGMPEIMEPYLRQSSLLKDFKEVISQICGISRCPHRRGENEVVILPTFAGESSLKLLLLEMFTQPLQDVFLIWFLALQTTSLCRPSAEIGAEYTATLNSNADLTIGCRTAHPAAYRWI